MDGFERKPKGQLLFYVGGVLILRQTQLLGEHPRAKRAIGEARTRRSCRSLGRAEGCTAAPSRGTPRPRREDGSERIEAAVARPSRTSG